MNNKIKEITLIGVFAGVLFVLEQALMFLPNIQLTVFLIILFSKKLGLKRTLIIITIYVLLDNLVIGSFSLVFTPFMFIGWALIPLTLCTIFRKVNSTFVLSLLSMLYAFLYSWIYIIPNVIVYEYSVMFYLSADIVFEIILAISSFLSVLWLYNPLSNALEKLNINVIKE